MKTKGIFIKRCPLCNGRNLYTKGFMGQTMGCRDCEDKLRKFIEHGISEEEAIKIMTNASR